MKKKNEWEILPKVHIILEDNLEKGRGVYLFFNNRTGELKLFSDLTVEKRGTEAIVKELNK